jgi:nitroimidazol reductase NimA-like FMN-containing flavoprotein (pyridoxamine 5'-phosphate oxidase superfamily)
MLDRIMTLVRQKNVCVLATVSGARPHCSLMAYAPSADCREIYLATLKNTRKFRSVRENPSVSLLIDSREALPRTRAQALTVEGSCAEVEDGSEKVAIRERLIAAHPHLENFLDDPDTAILRVTVASFLLLEGLTEAHHVDLRETPQGR